VPFDPAQFPLNPIRPYQTVLNEYSDEGQEEIGRARNTVLQ